MKAYKCDICGGLFEEEDRCAPTSSTKYCGLLLVHMGGLATDICPSCLEKFRNFIKELSPEEEPDEPEASSGEC